jgi:hypothetical protein
MKRLLFLSIFLAAQQAAISANPDALIGVYSNQAEGFYVETLCLSKDGRGYYFVSVIGVPVRWTYDAATSKITIKGKLEKNQKVEEVSFIYKPETKTVITNEKAVSPEKPELKFLQKEIPEKLQQGLDRFNWDFSKHEIRSR